MDSSPRNFRLHGYTTSLYHTLPPESVSLLENAILQSAIGNFSSALHIFATELAPFRNVPVVAIEHAEALQKQGLWKLIGGVLRESLNAANGVPDVVDRDEYRLIRLFLGLIEILANGTLRRALEETANMRSWLGGVPVEEYNDVKVACIRKYCGASAFISISSESNLSAYGCIPSAGSAGAGPWHGLTHLRESLFRQGRLWEASSLLRAERGYIHGPTTVQAYLDAYERLKPIFSADPVFLLVQGEGRLIMAQEWTKSGDIERAEVELKEATDLFERFLGSQNVRVKEHTSPVLQVKYCRYKLIPENELQTRWVAICRYIEDTKAASQFSQLTRGYREATEIAYELFEKGSSIHREHFFRLHEELESCLTGVMGDVYNLSCDHSQLVLHGLSYQADLRRALEWYDGFDRQYPEFCLPSVIYNRESLKALAYTILGDGVRVELARKQLAKWKAELPRGGDDWRSNALALSRLSPEEIDVMELMERGDTFDSEETAISSREPKLRVFLRVLSRWIERDLGNGILSQNELSLIMSVGVEQGPSLDRAFDEKGRVPLVVGDGWSSITAEYLCSTLFGQFGKPVEDSSWKSSLGAIVAWLERTPSVSNGGKRLMHIYLREARVESLKNLEKSGPIPTIERTLREELVLVELKHCVDIFETLTPFAKYSINSRRAMWRWDMAQRNINIALFSRQPLSSEGNKDRITEAYKLYKLSAGEFAQQGDVHLAMLFHNMAKACWLRHVAGVGESPNGVLRTALSHLQDAERILVDVRSGLSLPGGEDSSVAVMQGGEGFGDRNPSWILSEVAVPILYSIGGHDSHVGLWDWVQKAKARALAGLLGSSISQSTTARVDSESRRLLDEEKVCLRSIREAKAHERFHLRAELHRIQTLMREKSELATMMDMRDGVPITVQGLEEFVSSARLGDAVVFVDWFHAPPLPFSDGIDLYLILAKQKVNSGDGASRTDIRIYPLETRLATVTMWVEKYLTGDTFTLESAESHGYLHQLEELVRPLGTATRPRDVLVFCPTRALNQIPLHAMRVGGEILIRRNPIVYCYSLSIIRYCYFSAQQQQKSFPNTSPGVALFADPQRSEQLKCGRQAVESLGRRFGVLPAVGRSATKARFMEEVAISRLVHFHGHCKVTKGEPMLHRIELYNSRLRRGDSLSVKVDQPQGKEDKLEEWKSDDLEALSDEPYESGSDDEDMTNSLMAHEVFGLTNSKGSHVTLIACQTNAARARPGDEAQGLVPAFLCSGASSSVSTLWNVPDQAGAKFATRFYDKWESCRTSDRAGQSFIDLARAFQKAILAIFTDTDLLGARFTNDPQGSVTPAGVTPLYYWAAFVLQGWWHFDFNGELD